MKKFFLLFVFIGICSLVQGQDSETFKDPRDGKVYKIVTIGEQTWMAENLAHRPRGGGVWAYNNDQKNVAKHGYLYNWETALNVCPDGWHLPSDNEWKELQNFVKREALGLKAKDEWGENSGSTNSYGFSAIPSGQITGSGSRNMGTAAFWWSSTERKANDAWAWSFDSFHNRLARPKIFKVNGISVRCVKD